MLCQAHIPRTGGTTLIHILRRSFGPRHCDVLIWRSRRSDHYFTARDLVRLQRIYPRLESIRGHRIVPYGDLDYRQLRHYTFLRDPRARCLSHFRRRGRGREESLQQWIARPENRNLQTRHLAGCEDATAAIELLEERIRFVGLTERYDESLVMLQRWAGHGQLDIRYGRPVNGSGPGRAARQLADNPTWSDLLAEANQEDQKLYDYVCEHVYPRQQRKHGPGLERDVAHFQQHNDLPPVSWRWRLGRLRRDFVFKPLRAWACRGAQRPEPYRRSA